MIYSFFGNDIEKVRTKVAIWINRAQEKESNLTYIRMTPDTFDENVLIDSLEGQSLFAKKLLISLDGVAEVFSLDNYFKKMSESKNVFVSIETKTNNLLQKELEKFAIKQFVYMTPEKGVSKEIFAIGNAFARRDLLGMWIAYHEALFRGDQPQQVFGVLHAKIRKLIQEGSRNFSKEELETLSHTGIVALQESRQGVWSAECALEYFLLSIQKA